MAQKAGILKIPQSTEVSEAAAVAEIMIVGDAVENYRSEISYANASEGFVSDLLRNSGKQQTFRNIRK